jgi:hypothetical protein
MRATETVSPSPRGVRAGVRADLKPKLNCISEFFRQALGFFELFGGCFPPGLTG